MDPVLSSRGPFGVHLDWLDAALAAAESVDAPSALMSEAYEARGRARRVRGRTHEALADLGKARTLAKDAGAPGLQARALAQIGFTFVQQGKLEDARACFDEGLRLSRAAGDAGPTAILLNFSASIQESAPAEARVHFEESLALHRKTGNRRAEGVVLGNLGVLLRRIGDLEGALDHYERALVIHREAGNRSFEGNELGKQASVLVELGRLAPAREQYLRALQIHAEVGNTHSLGIFLGNLGILEALDGNTSRASELLRDSRRMFVDAGDARLALVFEAYERAIASLHDPAEGHQARLHEIQREFRERGDATYGALLDVLVLVGRARNGEPVGETLTTLAGSGAPPDVRIAARIVELATPAPPARG